MTSKTFVVAESVVAFCGLVLVVLALADWTGSSLQIASLVFAVLMLVAGLVAAATGLHRRQQGRRTRR